MPCIYSSQGMGEVAAVGPNSTLQPGQNVAYNMYGAFGEYHVSLDST